MNGSQVLYRFDFDYDFSSNYQVGPETCIHVNGLVHNRNRLLPGYLKSPLLQLVFKNCLVDRFVQPGTKSAMNLKSHINDLRSYFVFSHGFLLSCRFLMLRGGGKVYVAFDAVDCQPGQFL